METESDPMPYREALLVGHVSREFLWLGLDGPWVLRGRFAVQAGELVVANLRVIPRDWEPDDDDRPPEFEQIPGMGVTTDVLRSIKIGQVRQAIAARVQWWKREIDRGSLSIPPEATAIARALLPPDRELEAASSTARTGHPRLRDEFLEKVARAWIEEASEGRGALARMVDRFSDQTSSIDTVKFWKRRAEDAGWLTRPKGDGRGRLEAIPGPRLIRKLEQEGKK